MELHGERVLVVGTGKSGIAAATLLYRKGATVILQDGNAALSESEVESRLPEDVSATVVIGDLEESDFGNIDLVVLSPGVPTDLPMLENFRVNQIPIWGEIELAYQAGKGRVAAITGTNGKTTTTALTGEIMKTYYKSVYVVGNIGNPYTDIALDTTEESVIVAEMSSFQLETVDTFCPEVSAILNITPDHLNRHHTMENYIEAKARIFRNQTKDQFLILNYEDETLRGLAEQVEASVVYFSSARELKDGIYLNKDGDIICSSNGEKETVLNVKDMNLLGVHNYENVMAAVAISLHMGVPMECIRKAVCEFKAVEHRIEYTRTVNGVRYYNDSKGTNPDAAIKGIQAMDAKTYLIGGGYDKKSSYEEWIRAFDGKVKKLILIGQTKMDIARACETCGFKDYVLADNMEEAVDICYHEAEEGECVLLSPACASWGMYPNYEVRGKHFKELVAALPERNS